MLSHFFFADILNSMRLIHTSDWHLGRLFYGQRRDGVFTAFLEWLTQLIAQEKIEGLIVAGDIFDTTTPSHAALTSYFNFLHRALACGCRHIVIVGGNHDSPSLLNASKELLSPMGVTVVGQATEDPADEVVLLKDAHGSPQAVVIAVPFLRERDVRVLSEHESAIDTERKIREGTARHYERCLERALELRGDAPIPIIATGHLFAAQARVTESTRDLYVGSLGQIPADVFPEAIDYLALGHIHGRQLIGGIETRCYCGAPIPFDFSEAALERSVTIVDTDARTCKPRRIPVPAFDRLVSLQGTPQELLDAIRKLKKNSNTALEVFCEAHCTVAGVGDLAEQLATAAQQAGIKLVRTTCARLETGDMLAEETITELEQMSPREMFEIVLENNTKTLDEPTKSALRLAHADIVNELLTADTNA